MVARRLIAVLLLLTAACLEDIGGPEESRLYVLERIGSRPLPTWLYGPGDSYLILADSLFLPGRSGRPGTHFIIDRTQVTQSPGQPPAVSRSRHDAQSVEGTLVVDTCPLGAFCVASLVYAPFILKYDGDLLREELPAGATWEARVYRLVRGTVRPR